MIILWRIYDLIKIYIINYNSFIIIKILTYSISINQYILKIMYVNIYCKYDLEVLIRIKFITEKVDKINILRYIIMNKNKKNKEKEL